MHSTHMSLLLLSVGLFHTIIRVESWLRCSLSNDVHSFRRSWDLFIIICFEVWSICLWDINFMVASAKDLNLMKVLKISTCFLASSHE